MFFSSSSFSENSKTRCKIRFGFQAVRGGTEDFGEDANETACEDAGDACERSGKVIVKKKKKRKNEEGNFEKLLVSFVGYSERGTTFSHFFPFFLDFATDFWNRFRLFSRKLRI